MLMAIIVSLVAFLAASDVYAAQASPEELILRRAAEAARKVEPEWRYSGTVCTCPPLMEEQVGVASGYWERSSPDGLRPTSALVYTISTAKAAAGWLDRQLHGEIHKGWSVAPYDLGDGASLMTDTSGGTTHGISVRKGRFIIIVNSRSEDTAKRFAEFVLAALPH
jgi:hypothetical protein